MGTARSRREFLLTAAAVGGSVLATSVTGCASPVTPTSARELLAGERFFVAHRGAGDEAPEHTMAAYRNALEYGAAAIEISVRRSADGVLLCHHDATLERTCAGAIGTIAEMTAAELGSVRVDMRRWVGPSWEPAPIPTLDEVLDRIGSRAVLFVEPKDPAATADVLRTIADHGLEATTVFKQHHGRTDDVAARQAGLAVWNYLDDSVTEADVTAVARRSDAIGVRVDESPTAAQVALARIAVATNVPVIAWAVRRRHQLRTLDEIGVRGFMCSSWRYLAGPHAAAAADGFASGYVQPGDLPFDDAADLVPVWNPDASIGLANTASQQSLVMGSMGPIGSGRHRISVDLRFDALPLDDRSHAGVVVGRPDDVPYEFRGEGTPAGGFLVILRASGRLELRQVPAGRAESLPITSVDGEPVVPGRWETVQVTVEPGRVGVRRTPEGGEPRVINAAKPGAGGYFVLTRNFSGTEGAVRFRNIRVTSG